MARTQVCQLIAASALATLAASAPAIAKVTAVTISKSPTRNMSCAAGVCAPTAKNAVLNVGDLKTMLASGDVEVTTTGSDVQADNIEVRAPIDWKSATTLTLDAYDSIAIAEPVSLKGAGGLDLVTDDGGSSGALSFAKKGHVTFKKLTSSLVINGAAYTLVGNIATLASDIAANPAGDYALAKDYNAAGDGTYSGSPVATTFTGTFDGLGNKISNLAIDAVLTYQSPSGSIGLFSLVEGHLRDTDLVNATVTVDGSANGTPGVDVGELMGVGGDTENCHATGQVNVTAGLQVLAGGLIGSGGPVYDSSSAASVTVIGTVTYGGAFLVGGLIGLPIGDVQESYASGAVTSTMPEGTVYAGGLVGGTDEGAGIIGNSYAMGAVSATTSDDDTSAAESGGLVGAMAEPLENSYATGTVYAAGGNSSGLPTSSGGLIGWEATSASVSGGYWNTTTSDTETGVGYGSASGVTGLTTEQFQSGLPAGFARSIWREKPKINGGLPYLIAIPPAR